MKLIAVFLIALSISASFAQDDEHDQEALQKIQKMESSEFGQTLIDTIQIQMNAGSPVDDLMNMLRSMEQDLRDEQTEDDTYIFNLQSQCDEELARLQDEVAAAKQRVAELTTELGEKIPVRDSKETLLKRKQEFIVVLRAKQNELNERKQVKDAEWTEEQEQHNQAETTIVRAKQIIEEALSSPSFLQKTAADASAFVQVSNQITTSMAQYNFKRQGWKQIFAIIAEVSNSQDVQADKSAVQLIVEICEDLIDKIAESREIERKDYQHWVDEYQTTYDQLEARANESLGQQAELEAEITTLTTRINMCQQEKTEQATRVLQKTSQHDERENWCDDENRSYSVRRQQRDDNRSVVSDAIAVLVQKLRTFKKYVGDRQARGRA